MIPTSQDVYTQARAELGDSEVIGGQSATDAKLRPHLRAVWQDFIGVLNKNASEKLKRYFYYNLPANTSYLSPDVVGINNLGSLIDIWERSILKSATITAATPDPSTPSTFVDLTANGHPFIAGENAVVFGIIGYSDNINDQFCISVPNANTIRLNGCQVIGFGPAAGGTISTSGDPFPTNPLTRLADILNFSVPASVIGYWAWKNNVIRLMPCATARQLRIAIRVSSTLPDNASEPLGIDGCDAYLGAATAAGYAGSKGASSISDRIQLRAEQFLKTFLGLEGKDLQAGGRRFIAPPYRRVRNTGPFIRY
jgi:hypothetical protein